MQLSPRLEFEKEKNGDRAFSSLNLCSLVKDSREESFNLTILTKQVRDEVSF